MLVYDDGYYIVVNIRYIVTNRLHLMQYPIIMQSTLETLADILTKLFLGYRLYTRPHVHPL